jgi:cell shape-determining protein MreC
MKEGIIETQDVEQIYPEIVNTDTAGYKSIDYTRFAPILIEAVKELNRKLENQQQEMQNLKAENRTLKSSLNYMQSKIQTIEAKVAGPVKQGSGKK